MAEDLFTVETIDASELEVYTIDLDGAFTALGESNEQLKHTLLNGREMPDQHPIMAITGLENELNEIKSLKTVYSNAKNHANYYMWQDENPLQENREGFFVSIYPTTNKIQIYGFDEEVPDVFGVTVDTAGFVGGQDDVARDDKYGLVACGGIVAVRCESDVAVGDYVVPNRHGIAEKAVCTIVNEGGTTTDIDGKCGYLVVALDDTRGVPYAEILLGISAKQLNNLDTDMQKFSARLGKAETNITSAINVATEAHYLASNLGDIGNLNIEVIEKANDAVEMAEQAIATTNSHAEQVAAAKKTSEEAKIIAQSAVTSAESIRKEAVATANNALKEANDLEDRLEPITTWNDESGTFGATYFVDYINNGLATKTELETATTATEDLKLLVNKNAAGIETLVSSVAIYSLGEYSQAYGLTQAQAESILDIDMIYVPTQDHTETYEGSVYGEREFSKGYFYTWDGKRWWSSDAPYVAFSTEYIIGNDSLCFWVVDSEEAVEYNGVVYEPDTLHMWRDNRWVVVADLASNPNNRIANTLRYTTNALSAEITNARGSFSGLNLRLENTESTVDLLAKWKGALNDSMAAINLTADDLGASITQIVESVGKDGRVSAASIVTAINESGDSSIVLKADHINVDGAFTTNGNAGFKTDGGLFAKRGDIGGWNITDVTIQKTVWMSDGTYRTTGLQVPNSGTWSIAVGATNENEWKTAPFRVDHYGNMHATSGNVGGWLIGTNGIGNTSNASSGSGSGIWMQATPSSNEYFINCVNYGDYTKYFRVKSDGTIQASGANITGNSKIGGWNLVPYYWAASLLYTKEDISNGGKVTVGTGMAGAADNAFESTSFPAFWAGYTGGYSHPYAAGDAGVEWIAYTPFYVTHGGYLHATNAHIEGNITASSGTIGGCSITNGVLQIANANIGSLNVGKLTAGTNNNAVTFTNITVANGGKIGNWNIKDGNIWGSSDAYLTVDAVFAANNGMAPYKATWYEIATKCGAPTSSDIRLKNNITYFDNIICYDEFFDSLSPCAFKFNDEIELDDKTHFGFIAQDIVKSSETHLSEKQLSATWIDQDGYYKLNKEEFIALNTWQIQKLKARVAELEEKISKM